MRKVYIYKFTNKITKLSYIGRTLDMQRRIYQHEYSSRSPKAVDYNTQFHRSIRKYGLEAFDISILEECVESTCVDLERYYIAKFNTYKRGYNGSEGGDEMLSTHGSKNPRALMKEADVYSVREQYAALVPFREVYAQYSHIISKRGFQNIWYGFTWKHIHMDVYTAANKRWHDTKGKRGLAAHNRIFTCEEYREIQSYKQEGLSYTEVYNTYYKDRCTKGTFEGVWYDKGTYKTCIDYFQLDGK